MTTEDDRLRQALTRPEPSITAHAALQQLRPTMQRARHRRRLTASVAALALLAGGGAGAIALVTAQKPATLRTIDADDTGQSGLTEPAPEPTTTAPDVATSLPSTVLAPDPTSSVPGNADDAPPDDGIDRGPDGQTPAPTIAPPRPAPTPTTVAPATTAAPVMTSASPTTPAPPTTAAAAAHTTITSDCGDVVVSVENNTVRIVSIAARPGYESFVSDDGPISIEVVLRGADDTCELHAEVESGVLDIEVQNPSADD